MGKLLISVFVGAEPLSEGSAAFGITGLIKENVFDLAFNGFW